MIKGPKANREGGFTLVEMLVASVILLLVLSVANALFFEAIVSWRYGESRMDVREGLRLGMDRMTRELRTAQQLTDMQSDRIEFVVLQDDGSEQVEYYVNISKELIRSTDGGDIVLAAGVDAFELTYLEENRVVGLRLGGSSDGQSVEFNGRVALRAQQL